MDADKITARFDRPTARTSQYVAAVASLPLHSIVVRLVRIRRELDGQYLGALQDQRGRWYRESWCCPTLDTSRYWPSESELITDIAGTLAELDGAGIAVRLETTHEWLPWPEQF